MLSFTLSFSPWGLSALVRLLKTGEIEEVPGVQELVQSGLCTQERRKIPVPLANGAPGQKGEALRLVYAITPVGLKFAEFLAFYSQLGEPYSTIAELLQSKQ